MQPLNLPPPVAIAGPERGSDFWTAKSLTANRPISVDLELDGATGSIISRKGFRDRQLIDKLVGIGSTPRRAALWLAQSNARAHHSGRSHSAVCQLGDPLVAPPRSRGARCPPESL